MDGPLTRRIKAADRQTSAQAGTAERDPVSIANELIERHEGYSQFPKADSHNTVQIGYGTNLSRRGLSEFEAAFLLAQDVSHIMGRLEQEDWWAHLAAARQAVLIDMAYNLGVTGLFEFKHMLADIAAGRYELAADAMLSSEWASQVGARAEENARIMRTGIAATRT
jgi:lysozyme